MPREMAISRHSAAVLATEKVPVIGIAPCSCGKAATARTSTPSRGSSGESQFKASCNSSINSAETPEKLLTKLRGFLISCAMPAVNWPSDASFSVCTRRSSLKSIPAVKNAVAGPFGPTKSRRFSCSRCCPHRFQRLTQAQTIRHATRSPTPASMRSGTTIEFRCFGGSADIPRMSCLNRLWPIAAFVALQHSWSILEQERTLFGMGAGSAGRD
jgi:hypothetical protein